MILIVIAFEGDMTVDADERGGSTPAECVLLCLFLFESGIAVRTDKGYHLLKYINLTD